MKILFVGGTGIISSACVTAALEAGHEVSTLNRGRSWLHSQVGAEQRLIADASNEEQVREVLKGRHFDVVIQWTAYVPAQVELDVRLYSDVGQYVFISSASAYEKPPSHWLITETTPLKNPYWQYSRDKIACEEVLTRAYQTTSFPMTIIRPSLTYGLSQIPVSIGSWEKPFTIVERMRRRSDQHTDAQHIRRHVIRIGYRHGQWSDDVDGRHDGWDGDHQCERWADHKRHER